MATEDQIGGDIARLAEQAARELLEAIPTLKDANSIDKSIAISEGLRAKECSAARLASVFSDDSSFGHLRAGWIQQRGGFGRLLEGREIPYLLIKSVIDGCSADSVVAEARAFAGSPTGITEWFGPLAGVEVAEPDSLDDNLELIPWASVPDGEQKTVFSRQGAFDALSSGGAQPMRVVASSALRIRSAECQVLFSSNEEAKGAGDSANELTVRTEQALDVVRCLTALSARGVASLGSWAQFDKKIANDIAGSGYSFSGDLFANNVRAAVSRPTKVDGEAIAKLFHQFQDFRRSEKDVMRVSLDRLNQAFREQNIVDKAIDLGIALEVMLLHGIGKNDRGELRFRSSIRGATFLEGKKSERLRIFKLLKDAYDLRSKAVHSGVLKEGQNGQARRQILEDAASTCARIARKLIERGSFPHWDDQYVIGGE